MKKLKELLKKEDITLADVEFYSQEGQIKLFLCSETGTGADYCINSVKDIGEAIIDYIENYY